MTTTTLVYHVVKTIPSRPGAGAYGHPSLGTSVPEREVVMSRHRTAAAAERAMAGYRRDDGGYSSFRVERE